MFYCSPQTEMSVTPNLEKNTNPPSFKKPQTRYRDSALPLKRDLKNGQFCHSVKVGEELVPAELCQRTSRSLKLPRKGDPAKSHSHLPFLPRCSKSRIHLLTQPQASSGSSMSKIFETPQARRGTLAAQLMENQLLQHRKAEAALLKGNSSQKIVTEEPPW